VGGACLAVDPASGQPVSETQRVARALGRPASGVGGRHAGAAVAAGAR